MLYAIAALLLFQLIGELTVHFLALPIPGALVGMLLMFAVLMLRHKVPGPLHDVSMTLLRNMMLLFIPVIAGVIVHSERVAAEWLPFILACVAGTAATLAVTALTLRWMMRRMTPAATGHAGTSADTGDTP